MTITVELSPDTERKLRDKARQLGQTLEVYLQQLAEQSVENGTLVPDKWHDFPKFISRPRLTVDEVDHLLDEFSAGPPGKVLPPDFSRADIYDDHD